MLIDDSVAPPGGNSPVVVTAGVVGRELWGSEAGGRGGSVVVVVTRGRRVVTGVGGRTLTGSAVTSGVSESTGLGSGVASTVSGVAVGSAAGTGGRVFATTGRGVEPAHRPTVRKPTMITPTGPVPILVSTARTACDSGFIPVTFVDAASIGRH